MSSATGMCGQYGLHIEHKKVFQLNVYHPLVHRTGGSVLTETTSWQRLPPDRDPPLTKTPLTKNPSWQRPPPDRDPLHGGQTNTSGNITLPENSFAEGNNLNMSKKRALYSELNMSGAEAPGPCTEEGCVVEFLLFSYKRFCTVQFGMCGVRVLYRESRPPPIHDWKDNYRHSVGRRKKRMNHN